MITHNNIDMVMHTFTVKELTEDEQITVHCRALTSLFCSSFTFSELVFLFTYFVFTSHFKFPCKKGILIHLNCFTICISILIIHLSKSKCYLPWGESIFGGVNLIYSEAKLQLLKQNKVNIEYRISMLPYRFFFVFFLSLKF